LKKYEYTLDNLSGVQSLIRPEDKDKILIVKDQEEQYHLIKDNYKQYLNCIQEVNEKNVEEVLKEISKCEKKIEEPVEKILKFPEVPF